MLGKGRARLSTCYVGWFPHVDELCLGSEGCWRRNEAQSGGAMLCRVCRVVHDNFTYRGGHRHVERRVVLGVHEVRGT